jgi:hypothetical protein
LALSRGLSTQFAGDAAEHARASAAFVLLLGFVGTGWTGARPECRDLIFDFAIDRETANFRLGKHELAVNDYVELACFAGLDLGFFTEALFE